jgi:hypothetical protein
MKCWREVLPPLRGCKVRGLSAAIKLRSKPEIWLGILIWAVSSIGLGSYEHHLQNSASQNLFDGFYFQAWPSEEMGQTVNIQILREKGLLSFWYLHIQPPLYDFLRYLLSFEGLGQPNVATGPILDHRIYLFYCFIYGAFNQLIYLWSRVLGFGNMFAILVAGLWGVYPGNLAMATLLDSTYLSAFLIAWTIFSLYLYLREPSVRGLGTFLGIFLTASWTRTIFQIDFFVPLLATIICFIFVFHRQQLTRASIIALPLAIASFCLPLKQLYLYGTLETTTFAGEHKVEGIWYWPSDAEKQAIDVPRFYIENAEQLQSKLNSVDQVVLNYRYEKIFKKILLSEPALVLDGVQKSLKQGIKRMQIPTMYFTPNRLVETLPWTTLSGLLSKGSSYLLIILFGLLGYLWAIYNNICDFRPRFLFIIGFIGLVFTTIVIGSNRYEWTEAERLKFLIEAPVLLFSLQGIRLLFETSRRVIYAHSSLSDDDTGSHLDVRASLE